MLGGGTLADDKLETDTDGIDVLNNSVSGCISTVYGLGSALLNVAENAGKKLFSLGKSVIIKLYITYNGFK